MQAQIVKSNLERAKKQGVRLKKAKQQLSSVMPLDVKRFDPDQMDDQILLQLDGFRARFSDYQDLIGHVMFKLVCQLDQDETVTLPLSTRERQQLMEKKRLIDLQVWQILREIRNSFTHDYPGQDEEKALILNQAWSGADSLLAIGTAIESYLEKVMADEAD